MPSAEHNLDAGEAFQPSPTETFIVEHMDSRNSELPKTVVVGYRSAHC
jgi:hypothetical protein